MGTPKIINEISERLESIIEPYKSNEDYGNIRLGDSGWEVVHGEFLWNVYYEEALGSTNGYHLNMTFQRDYILFVEKEAIKKLQSNT